MASLGSSWCLKPAGCYSQSITRLGPDRHKQVISGQTQVRNTRLAATMRSWALPSMTAGHYYFTPPLPGTHSNFPTTLLQGERTPCLSSATPLSTLASEGSIGTLDGVCARESTRADIPTPRYISKTHLTLWDRSLA